ncbi:hypothetical protein LCGC14_1078140, partial [marine sediment metagenome]
TNTRRTKVKKAKKIKVATERKKRRAQIAKMMQKAKVVRTAKKALATVEHKKTPKGVRKIYTTDSHD